MSAQQAEEIRDAPKAIYLEYWTSADEDVFTHEIGKGHVFTGTDEVRDYLTRDYRPKNVPGPLMAPHLARTRVPVVL